MMETTKHGRSNKKSKLGAFLDPGPSTSGGGDGKQRKGGGSEPDLRKHRRERSHSTGGSGGEKERKREDNRCSCCRKHYSLMDTLKRVNPPKYCYYCREEVCKRCHSNDSCHRCFTRERSDIRSISRLEEMDRTELEKIMRDLHCSKNLFDQKEKAELILTILQHCLMDTHFIRQFQEHIHRKANPETQHKANEELLHTSKRADEQLNDSEPDVQPEAVRDVRRSRSLDHLPQTSTDISSSSSIDERSLPASELDFHSAFLQQLQSATDEQLRALSAVFSLMKPS